jgi:phage gpG-like protein
VEFDLGSILITVRGKLQTLREQLNNPDLPLANGKPLMKQIGILGVAASQKAFRMQALGDIKWPARYPNQAAPKFNIAGALMDWKSGRPNPKNNRFQDRPALFDTGAMKDKLSYTVSGPLSVKWGSPQTYAALHQEGGEVTIPYDDATAKRISEWLYKKAPQKGKMFTGVLRTNKVKTGNVGWGMKTRAEYAKHVRPLINSRVWEQNIIARPFVGVTLELELDINRTIKAFFEKAQK